MEMLRSLLFVPADSPRKIEKARQLRPDAVILDLEDAVALENKTHARTSLSSELERFAQPDPRVLVRVNSLQSSFFAQDLEVALTPVVDGIVLPKSEHEGDVAQVDETISSWEKRKGILVGKTKLLLLIESAVAVMRVPALSQSSERVVALLLGGEDYCADMGVTRTKLGEEIMYARWVIAHAAHAAGLEAIDTAFTDFEDDAGLLEETRRVKQMGFTGKLLIHPRQIDVAHRGFAPADGEIAWAERVVRAFDAAQKEGSGLVVVDGKMVDQPVVLQAKRILSRRDTTLKKEQEAQ